MKTSLTRRELEDYVSSQLNVFFPDPHHVDLRDYPQGVDLALQRLDHCFMHSALRHYCADGETTFNHLYSDHYVMFLWFLSNTVWREYGPTPVADKLYGLNKYLHGLDCTYATGLPDVFFLFHTVGTVLGKATYGNFFVASHGCTVGSHNGMYPTMGIGVALTAHASIIGGCSIGNRVSVGSNTAIFAQDIPDDTTVYRNETGTITSRRADVCYAQRLLTVNLRQAPTVPPSIVTTQ